ncbi:MAG TPA: hypothetical protein VMC79_02155 [Rectinemataceae bacterium]|nr:hypothetical protein [Rectinemataceae bacterium]
MKKILILLVCACLAIVFAAAQSVPPVVPPAVPSAAPSAGSQPAATTPAAPTAAPGPSATPSAPAAATPAAMPAATGQTASAHYSVISELGQDRSDALSRQLEAYFGLFDGFFHFPSDSLTVKLNVREFKDKAGFDSYLGQLVGETKDDFVYLHYPTPERSELVVFSKAEPDYSASLAHQALVQYLKAFVDNPPLWLREGFAVWFESATWDDKNGKLSFPENLAWLETVKTLKDKNLLMPLDKLMTLGQDDARSELDVFYPQAWALVSFLVNSSDKSYNRLLWDSLAALKKDASLDENQAAVAKLVGTWYGVDDATKALAAYLDSRKTFAELVAAGVRAYADKNWDAATSAFTAAGDMNADSYVPPYYLGLIAYAKNDFSAAEFRYKTALQLGCDPAITNYALGVNAYAQNRLDDAKAYLALAKQAAPDRYGAKVDELLAKFPKQ